MAGSPYLILALLLVAGAALYGLGTLLVRSANSEAPIEPGAQAEAGSAAGTGASAPSTARAVSWTSLVTGTDDALDSATRTDMIERLALVGEPWCIAAIKAAAETDDDAPVRDAAGRALRALR
ncbi:MAG TPA: hypothetical protein VMW12_11795 [Candidatus Dormibacteraeota bacterium]|nr:hypothetical protein [Candidatus Dormibacteraeota bacterium]